ncbi:aminoglycoside phosphotransferase family protein [Nonomuraea sp. CA-143628]|uniref:aminoglycoside phosphotransferase family protein n=1 Tax=Nonomuraea sp. CA-143628 TaxID=3239997 RepID=UPI003D8CCDA5
MVPGRRWLSKRMGNLEIDEDLVRSLVREQHPDLAGLDLREVDGGWSNQMWRLGDELAVRMPRTPDAPTFVRKEHQWMPVLTPRLPLPVPTIVRIGEPSERFPWPWTITAWVPGEPADRASITRGEHAADSLAGFLRVLHQHAPAEAPADLDHGGPLKALTRGFEQWIHLVNGTGDHLREVWEDAVSAPDWQGPSTWVHGDLHPANVVTVDGTLAGIIDFGALCAGDPASDLAAAWLLLPSGADTRFLTAYADTDEAMIRRARGWAILRGLMLISIGRAGDRGLPGGKKTWGPAGRSTIDRVLASI